MIICNRTRYYTEDLQAFADAVYGTDELTTLVVDYYVPSKSLRESFSEEQGTGLFVKLMRNGDECNLRSKHLGIVKPTRFLGVSDVEALAAVDGEAPMEVVRQVVHRFRLMRSYKGSDTGPRAYDAYNLPKAGVDVYIDKHKLRLRFHPKDPTREEIEWRRSMASARRQLFAAKGAMTGSKQELDKSERRIYEALERRREAEEKYAGAQVLFQQSELGLAEAERKGQGMIE